MKSKRARLLGLLTAVAVVVSGCAARAPRFTDRFVKPGEPSLNIQAARIAAPAQTLADYASRLRELQSQVRRAPATLLPTIESRDPRLAAALLQLAADPTAENNRRVAAAYRDAGVNDYAYRYLQRALRLEPCDAAAHDALARLWRDWGRAELAIGDAYRALYCSPNSAYIYNTLGTVLQALGQIKNARKAFERALALDSGAAYAANNLCYLSLQSGDGAAAQKACERALALEPQMTAARTNLALAHALQGDVAAAERRLRDSPDPEVAHYNVGILEMSLGKYAEAATEFDAAARTASRANLAAKQRAAQARALAAAQQE